MSTTPKFSRLDPRQRREQILDAANALFAERGYEEVSIEEIASSAGVTRGLVNHYFGARKDVYIALLERLGAEREEQLPPPAGRSARARVADNVSRWLDWTEANRTIWLATLGRGEDIGDPDVRRVVTDLVRRAVAILTAHHADIAEDTPRLRYALECWTGLNRAATRRWLGGEASREATQELLASTLEHVLRTFGAPPAPNRRRSPFPERTTVELHGRRLHSYLGGEGRSLDNPRVVARDESGPATSFTTTVEPSIWRAFAFLKALATASETVAEISIRRRLSCCRRTTSITERIVKSSASIDPRIPPQRTMAPAPRRLRSVTRLTSFESVLPCHLRNR